MLLTASEEETYCPRAQSHAPVKMGRNIVCYRCGFLFGPAEDHELGSLLDV